MSLDWGTKLHEHVADQLNMYSLNGGSVRGIASSRGMSKQTIIFDSLNYMYEVLGCSVVEEPKSLALLDAEDILYRTCGEDRCSWKEGQVARWCNKYSTKWK